MIQTRGEEGARRTSSAPNRGVTRQDRQDQRVSTEDRRVWSSGCRPGTPLSRPDAALTAAEMDTHAVDARMAW